MVHDDAATATTRVTAIVARSMNDAAMVISENKSKAMHIHPTTRVSGTKEAEVVALRLKHVCDSCSCHSASRNERILTQMVDIMLFTNTENSIYIIIRDCTRVGAFPRAFCVPNSVALASLTLQVVYWAIH